jgi:hypothetical protein
MLMRNTGRNGTILAEIVPAQRSVDGRTQRFGCGCDGCGVVNGLRDRPSVSAETSEV